jgi:hypothetical protein
MRLETPEPHFESLNRKFKYFMGGRFGKIQMHHEVVWIWRGRTEALCDEAILLFANDLPGPRTAVLVPCAPIQNHHTKSIDFRKR